MAEQTMRLPDVPSNASDAGAGRLQIPITVATGTDGVSSKETFITAGALLVVAVLLFIVKSAVSKTLVANMKKSPRSAEMAGWSLFGFLMFAAGGAALGILNAARFLTLPYLAPIGSAMVVLLVLFVVALVSRR